MPRSGVAFVLSGDVFRRRYAAVLVGGGKYLWQRRLRAPRHRLCSNMRYAHSTGVIHCADGWGDAAERRRILAYGKARVATDAIGQQYHFCEYAA